MVTSKLGTVREFARTVGMFVLATMTGFLIDVDGHWTPHYQTDETHVRTRNQARLWTVLVGLMHAVSIGLIWMFAKGAAAAHLPYGDEDGPITWELPPITMLMLDLARWGWVLVLLVAVEAPLLYRLRLRSGIHGWYAEVLHGLVMLGLVFLGGAIGYAAVAPFVPIGLKLD